MKLKTTRISRRTVEALPVGRDTVFWDSELSGFGVRVYPTGRKQYVVQTRERGKAPRRLTLGSHGVVTPEEARRRAALAISRIKSGEDPVPEEARQAASPAVGRLARQWLEQHVEIHCKPKSISLYRVAVDRHILPAVGRTPALSLKPKRVVEIHHSLRDTPVMANNVIRVLSRIWHWAEERGELPEGKNPCRGVVFFRQDARERFLSDAEFRRLGETLESVEASGRMSIYTISAIRLLLLTGCRKNEILTLKWAHVDLAAGQLNLEGTKTGARTVMLSPEAVEVIAGIPRKEGNPYVIAGLVPGKHLRNLNGSWQIIRQIAGIGDVRLHDLRHSFASRALALGESLPAIGKLLGHRRVETTARYAHLAQDTLRHSAERIANSIAADIRLPGYRSGEVGETVFPAP